MMLAQRFVRQLSASLKSYLVANQHIIFSTQSMLCSIHKDALPACHMISPYFKCQCHTDIYMEDYSEVGEENKSTYARVVFHNFIHLSL